MSDTLLHQLKRYDDSRDNFPGEHWVAFAAGLGLWIATRKHPSITVRVLASVMGTLLVARAATGRDVPAPLSRLPWANRPSRASDLIG